MIYKEHGKIRLHLGATKVKKAYKGTVQVYSSGNVCTYHVDTGVTYQEEVDEGKTVLNPKTFTPKKDGWTFLGWCVSMTNHNIVSPDMVMGDDPIDLYAVYYQNVTLTTKANGATSTQTKQRKITYNGQYYDNPKFTVANPSKSGATFKGWSGSASSTSITNSTINNMVLTSSTSRFAVFGYQNATANANGSAFIVPNNWVEPSPYYAATVLSGIDCSKYGAISFTAYGYLRANGGAGNCYLVVRCGGTQIDVGHSYTYNSGQNVVEANFETGKNVSLSFSQNSGNTSLVLDGRVAVGGYHAENRGWLVAGNRDGNGPITLIGRTVVG